MGEYYICQTKKLNNTEHYHNKIMDTTPTPEEIAQHYSAALDSVNLINELVGLETLSEKQAECIDRNVRHLQLMVAKSFWTNEDMTPLTSAVSSGTSKIG